ncbi:hypothetical protein COB55_06005 [Candidatus Wolfebacteria bacterium]|nr:MAG: hypothetical protein COB55_06005 [Candidatus Wolfebacteria bacterium]
MIREKIVLPSKKHKLSTDKDTQIRLNLDSNTRLLKENNIVSVLNLDDQTNKERQESSIYRIYGKISLVTYDEQTRISSINTFSSGGTIEVVNKLKSLSNSDINLLNRDNWEIQILYPFSSDTKTVIDTRKTKYRRLFKVLTTSDDYNIIKSGFETNSYGDRVIQFIFNKDIDISGISDYLGRPITDMYLSIVKKLSPTTTDLDEGFNRTYSGSNITDFVKSDHYIGDEVIEDSIDLTQEIVSTRFHKFFDTHTGILVFEDTFDLNIDKGWSGLFIGPQGEESTLITNDALRFISGSGIALWNGFVSFNNILEIGKSYEISFDITSVPDSSFGDPKVTLNCGTNIGTDRIITGTYREILTCTGTQNLGFKFIFNSIVQGQGEIIDIDNIVVVERESTGYYYKPFYRIDIRKFSNNVLEGNTGTTLGIPSYATEVDAEGNRRWRELLPIGTIEDETNGVDYPFVNDKHYLYDNYQLFVRRVIPIHELSGFDLNPVDETTIEVISTFGKDDRIPLSPEEDCVVKQDGNIIDPGSSGPGTSAKDKQDKIEKDFNEFKC